MSSRPIFIGKSTTNDKYITNLTDPAYRREDGTINFKGCWVIPCDMPPRDYQGLLKSRYKHIARRALMTELIGLLTLETGDAKASESLVTLYLSQFLNSRKQLDFFFSSQEIEKPAFWDDLIDKVQSPFPTDLLFTTESTTIY